MLGIPDRETIIAQCTPHGSGALALLRLSGDNAIACADEISKLASNKKLAHAKSHTIHYGWVVDQSGAHIDQVLFLLMMAPHTFTGQDTVEITCHNNPFIVEAIVAQALIHGARIAQEGEFSKRAVLNNKIDLVQAEAINELIHANTQLSLKKSLAQLQGSFSSFLHSIERDLIKALAFSEASFEFIDEEDMAFGNQIQMIVTKTLQTIAELKISFDQQNQIRDGIRICIVGSVNAGKSSLFNALLSKERAIVTNIAGTTRDSIEAGLYKDGNYWTVIDTAGLRETNDIVEMHGIKRSFQEARKADIILLVFDASRNLGKHEITVYEELIAEHGDKIIGIKNKIDLPIKAQIPDGISKIIDVSTFEKAHITELEASLKQKIAALFAGMASPFMLNKRQFSIVCSLEMKLQAILPLLKNNIQYEIVSHHLNDALANFSELTGKSISEQGMDAVFKEFCVGK